MPVSGALGLELAANEDEGDAWVDVEGVAIPLIEGMGVAEADDTAEEVVQDTVAAKLELALLDKDAVGNGDTDADELSLGRAVNECGAEAEISGDADCVAAGGEADDDGEASDVDECEIEAQELREGVPLTLALALAFTLPL